jgi:hypothetical protein
MDLYWIWKCLLQFQLNKQRVTEHVFLHSYFNLHERKNIKMIMKLKRSRTIYTTVLVSVLSRFKIHVMLLLKNIKFSKYLLVINFRMKFRQPDQQRNPTCEFTYLQFPPPTCRYCLSYIYKTATSCFNVYNCTFTST